MDGDYEEVRSFLYKCGQRTFPRDIGGYGLVGRSAGEVTGFIWALVGLGEIAVIEYLAVGPEKRSTPYAFILMSKMLNDLYSKGKRYVIGFMNEDAPYTDSMTRMCNDMGMRVEQGFTVGGDIETIIDNMRKKREK